MALTGTVGDSEKPAEVFYEHDDKRTFGPEIKRDVTFTWQNYAAQVTNSHDLQGDELPSEWLRRATRLWGTVKVEARIAGLLGFIAGVLPIVILLALVGFDLVSAKSALWQGIHGGFLYAKRVIFNDWISALVNLACLFFGGVVVTVGWHFIRSDVFGKAGSEKQIWIGGGTTAVGVGRRGISIKTMRAIFALDWDSIEKYEELKGATSRKWKCGRRYCVEKGDAVQLNLRSVGEGRDRCRDVLIIPKRFFDEQSEITWDAFLQTLRRNVP